MPFGGLPLATYGVGKKMEDAAIEKDRRERELLAQQKAAAAAAEDAARANVTTMFGNMMRGPLRNLGYSRAVENDPDLMAKPAAGPGGVGGPEEPQGEPQSAPRKPLAQMSEKEQQEYFRYLQLKAKVAAAKPKSTGAGMGPVNPMVAMGQQAQREYLSANAPARDDVSTAVPYGDPAGTARAQNNAFIKSAIMPGYKAPAAKPGDIMRLPQDEVSRLKTERDQRDLYDTSKAVVFGPGGEAVSVNSFGDPLIGPVDKDLGKGILTLPVRAERAAVGAAEAAANAPGDLMRGAAVPYEMAFDPAVGGMMAGWEYGVNGAGDAPERFAQAYEKGGYAQKQAALDAAPRFDFRGAKIPVPQELESITGSLAEGFMQYAIARGALGKLAPGGGVAFQRGKDTAALGVGFSGDSGRTADLIDPNSIPEGLLRDYVQFLKSQPGDSPLTGRLKNMTEDATINLLLMGLGRTVGAVADATTPKTLTPTNAGGAAARQATSAAQAAPSPMAVGVGAPAAAAPPPQPSSLKQAANVLAATVLPGTTIRPQAFKAIERVLVESGVPRDRITAGINRIAQSIPSLTGRPPTVTQLLQREFGPDFPQVEYNLNLVARERGFAAEPGDASSSIVHNTAKDMRQSQGDFLNESAQRNLGTTPVLPEIERLQNSQVPRITTAANRNFGTQARLGSREQIAENLRQMSREGYEPILSQPIDGTRQDDILYTLHGPQMGELMRPLRQIAAGEGLNLDQFIAQQPLRAAHWMQHKARLLAEANETNTPLRIAYTNMRDRILLSLDDLQAPDGRTYQQLRHEYGDEAQIDNAMNAGDRFGAAVRNPEGMDTFIQRFNQMTPQQRQGGWASIRDWVFARLRGGQEDAPARIGELTQRGVLDALDRLGPEGQAFANELRAIRNENKAIETIKSAGTSFSSLVQSPEQLTQTLANFRQLSPQQQQLFLGNVRDWVQGRLRGGREDAPARVQYLAQIGVLDALDQLTPEAKRLADDIRTIRDENQFLSAITNKNPNGADQSATFTNQTAAAEAPGLYSRKGVLPRSAGAVMTDMATMGVGMSNAPVFTAAKTAQKLYKGWQLPRKKTREDMTRLLMARPIPGQAPVAPTGAPVGPSGAGGSGSLPLMGRSAASVPQPVQPTMPIGAQPTAPRATMAVGAPQRRRVSRPEPTEPEWTGPTPSKPQSILAWIRSQGGIMDRNFMTGDTKQALGGRSQAYPGLINNKSGKGLDDLVAAAYHEGFDVNPDDANSLMRLIEEELAGNPSYRIGQKEEWDVYQEFLNSKDRGPKLETPPELGGAALGGVIGATVPADLNQDGVVSEDERAKALLLGIGVGGVVGNMVRHSASAARNPALAGVHAAGFSGGASQQPWQKAMKAAGFDAAEVDFAHRYMLERFQNRTPEQIAANIGTTSEALSARVREFQARLDDAGVGVELNTGRIAPELVGRRAPHSPPVRADKLPPVDIVTQYNDGDLLLDIGLDLDVPDASNARTVIQSRVQKLRGEAQVAVAAGNVEQLAKKWNVTSDQVERFAAGRPNYNAGQYQQSVERIVGLMEKAEKAGHPMRPAEVAQRLGMRPGSVNAMLSMARNGAKPLPPELVMRVKALKIVRGRPISPIVQMGMGGGSQPIFYSPLERAVTDATTKSAPAFQWKATIRNAKGVKAEEIEWSGVNDWLDMQKGNVSREDVADFIRNNGIQIEETVKGGKSSLSPEEQQANLAATEEFDRLTRVRNDNVPREAANATQDPQVLAAHKAYMQAEDAYDKALLSVLETDAHVKGIEDAEKALTEARRVLSNEIAVRRAKLSEQMQAFKQRDTGNKTKWDTYTLPGGENYRELLLTMPPKMPGVTVNKGSDGWYVEPAGQPGGGALAYGKTRGAAIADYAKQKGIPLFQSSHWDDPNVLAHVRFKERTSPAGKRVLAIEEIQSDWHQNGRDKGYQAGPWYRVQSANGATVLKPGGQSGQAIYPTRAEAEALAAMQPHWSVKETEGPGVANAPFKNNAWASLSLKRMIRWAAENGFDEIAWTPAKVQIDRFNLANHIGHLSSMKLQQGKYLVYAEDKGGQRLRQLGDNGQKAMTPDEMVEFFGRDMAKQLIDGAESKAEALTDFRNQKAPDWFDLRPENFSVGGEGMAAFYDNILVNEANRLGKKFGAQVGKAQLQVPEQNVKFEDRGKPYSERDPVWHSLPITPQLREHVMGGQALMTTGGTKRLDMASAAVGIGYGEFGPLEDLNNDGKKDEEDRRLMVMKYGVGGVMSPALLRGGLAIMRGGKAAAKSVGPAQAGFSAPTVASGEAPKLPNLIEDATDETLLKAQLDMIGRGEPPPVFKLFKLPNGRVIAWNGDEARGGFNHAQAREILGLGNQRLEHGQTYLGGPKLSQTNWYDVTGEGEAPRSIERMVKEGQRQGRNPGDVIGDAYPHEVERDLRSIGAMGPGNTLGDYPYRRSLAVKGTTRENGGHTIAWETPSLHDARLIFMPGGLPDQEIVHFRLQGRTSNLEGRNTVPMSEAKEAFDKATAILEREVIARGKNVYVFDGSIPQNTRRYAQSLQRLGAPQGYVALFDRKYGNFAFIKQSRFDADVASGRVDPKDWTIITSKRGSKEVPEWRRATGQFALPVGAAGAMAAFAAQQRADEPRPY